jgi:hypothetical protein
MDQEGTTRFEPDNQILASPFDGADAFALELGGDGLRLERPDETWVGDLDSVEPAPDQVRLELEADRLDFRQLGHRQAIVSSTIGRGGGASSPSA